MGWGRREGSQNTGGTRKLWEVMNMVIILILVMISQIDPHVKPYQAVHFKYLFTVCNAYLFKAVKNVCIYLFTSVCL